MSIETYENVKFDSQVAISKEHVSKNYKVLLISQNSTDIFLVNELLNKIGNFKVYEAGNIKAALKVVSYMSLDLIIVDDTLPTVSGKDVIKRLNQSQVLRDVPKVMLLTENYKKTEFVNASFENLDFIKKPIDGMIFKTRIHSILKNRQDSFQSGSIFENMIDKKINEAKEFLKIYKSFLDIDENLLFVYDKKSNQIVETNRHFTKFFGEDRLFNRVITNPRLIERFVPVSSDPNYLNNHHPSIWLDLINSVQDFNFLITLKNRSKEYTFNVLVNKIKLFNKEMYIVKLSNHNLHIANSNQVKFQDKQIMPYLNRLQNSLNLLNDGEQKAKIEHDIKIVLDELKVNSSQFTRISSHRTDEVNLYFVIASILKDRLGDTRYFLNLNKVDENLKLDHEFIYAKVSADALTSAVKGILDSSYERDMQVDVKIYKLQENMKVEIITTSKNHQKDSSTLVKKLFKKDVNSSDSEENAVPKHVKKAVADMHADLKTYTNNEQNIFLLTIPLA
jgi:DNA-binding response OmpR family regulator